MVDAMLEIDKDVYGKYVIHGNNGEKQMYVRLSKAMCGRLKAELLYYRILLKKLTEYRLVINPYGPCVANKWIDRGELTVVCHVDNMQVLHKNKEEVTKFVEYTKGIYGEEMPFERGKKHTYVGMDLDYSTPGEVIVNGQIHHQSD